MKFGATGSEVQLWQERLARRGFRVDIDGIFGEQTHNATLAFQAAAHLPTTGIVAEAEWHAVEEPLPPPAQPSFPDSIPFVECRYWQRGATRELVDLIVIHCMESAETATTAENCAHYLATLADTEPKRSAHYFVDCDSIVQGVREDCIAWHAPGANHNGIGIEHAGYARQTEAEWLDDFGKRMLLLSAELAARICKRWTIPPVFISSGELLLGKRGITTHAQVTKAFKRSTHMDPGQDFPMAWYLERVDAELQRINSEQS